MPDNMNMSDNYRDLFEPPVVRVGSDNERIFVRDGYTDATQTYSVDNRFQGMTDFLTYVASAIHRLDDEKDDILERCLDYSKLVIHADEKVVFQLDETATPSEDDVHAAWPLVRHRALKEIMRPRLLLINMLEVLTKHGHLFTETKRLDWKNVNQPGLQEPETYDQTKTLQMFSLFNASQTIEATAEAADHQNFGIVYKVGDTKKTTKPPYVWTAEVPLWDGGPSLKMDLVLKYTKPTEGKNLEFTFTFWDEKAVIDEAVTLLRDAMTQHLNACDIAVATIPNPETVNNLVAEQGAWDAAEAVKPEDQEQAEPRPEVPGFSYGLNLFEAARQK